MVAPVAIAALALAAAAPPTKTLRVDWHESKQLDTGRLSFTVTRIVVGPRGWRVTARVANESTTAFRVYRGIPGLGDGRGVGMSVVEAVKPVLINGGLRLSLFAHAATATRPRLPRLLAPGTSWSGTFGASTPLKRGRYSIGFGFFSTDGPPSPYTVAGIPAQPGVVWITDHSLTVP